MAESTLIVCGLGRCGTSMIMQMLYKGGFPVAGDYPDFEVEHYNRDDAELPANKAIKILDPHRISIKRGNYKWIWIRRDFKQQAKSMCKMAQDMGVTLQGDAWKVVLGSLRKETTECFSKIKKLDGELLIIDFEETLKNPANTAAKLSEYTGGIDMVRAVNCVQKRSPKNYNGFMELELLENN